MELEGLPLTIITIIFVGSDYKTLYRNYGEPTKKMVLVVNGNGSSRLVSPTLSSSDSAEAAEEDLQILQLAERSTRDLSQE